MGKGGRGGGGGGGIKLPRFMRGFTSRIFGASHGMTDALNQVAIARGLRDGDELVGRLLGKQAHEASTKEVLNLLMKECSVEEFEQIVRKCHYGRGKGYGPCNDLLRRYLQGLKDPERHMFFRLEHLKRYCGYTDDELNSLK